MAAKAAQGIGKERVQESANAQKCKDAKEEARQSARAIAPKSVGASQLERTGTKNQKTGKAAMFELIAGIDASKA